MTNDFQYDVFLSRSAKDKAVVRSLAERLRQDGLKVWFDEWVLKPGDSIPAKIEEGLEHSQFTFQPGRSTSSSSSFPGAAGAPRLLSPYPLCAAAASPLSPSPNASAPAPRCAPPLLKGFVAAGKKMAAKLVANASSRQTRKFTTPAPLSRQPAERRQLMQK
jgi:TIR domain